MEKKKIIECSLTKKQSLKKCAQSLGVKYITAKHIVKVYKRTGQITTKIMNKFSNMESKHGIDFTKAPVKVPEIQDYCLEQCMNNKTLQEELNSQSLF